MKGTRSVLIHFSVLLFSAVLAYAVFSTPETVEAVQDTDILEVTASDIEHISFASDLRVVEVSPRKSGGFQLAIFTRKDPTPDPAKLDEETDTEGNGDEADEYETKSSEYPASKPFNEKIEKLFPLQAKRSLGVLKGEALGRFGFAQGDGRLTVTAKGQKTVFDLGNSSYGGTAHYLRRKSDGAVFLVPNEVVQSFDLTAPRYMERRLIEEPKDAITGVTVRAGEKSTQLEKRGQGKDEQWIFADKPDRPSDMVKNWVGALFRLSATDYVSDDDLPALTPLAELDVIKDGLTVDTLSFAEAPGEDDKKDFFGKSTLTGSWVKLVRFSAEGVASDLASLLQGE